MNIKHRQGILGSPGIIPFIGFGNSIESFVSGIVVGRYGITRLVDGQGKWQNIVSMMRRYLANEIEDIRVRVTFAGQTVEAVTDRYGIYRCHFIHPDLPDGSLWQKASVSIDGAGQCETVEGDVMIVNKSPRFGIISDIDDTILVSYATQKLMKLKLLLLNNAHTRMPFEGVSAFYRALQHGNGKDEYNPVFYVSNSEWNLYDLLYEFILFHRIPKGPLLLREMAIRVLRPWKMKEVNKNHKTEVIRKLFTLYPDMNFILIGDSGQKDPEVYSGILREFPGRILSVYIRDVGMEEKTASVKIISQQASALKTEFIIVKDTEAAAIHAIEKGFISPEFLGPVMKEKEKDMERK